jgi:hypothetical protein
MRKHTIDGQEAKIRLYHDYGDYAARFKFEREAVWSFGVDGHGIATLLDTTADVELTREAIPAWIEEELLGAEVGRIEV